MATDSDALVKSDGSNMMYTVNGGISNARVGMLGCGRCVDHEAFLGMCSCGGWSSLKGSQRGA
eukprot:6623417-Lingulodinium_polyedra.AAC.1